MPSALAFLPWVVIDEALTIGPLRLLPYQQGKFPGNLPNATQADIDRVLYTYSNRPKAKIKKATILELGEWQAGMEAQGVLPALFQARNAIAFAALSQRRLFRQHFDYCNYDTYSLVVQRYAPGDARTFSFSTRRRDGGASHLWSSDEFAFHRPNHVDLNSRLSVDEPLLATLLSISDPNSSLLEAVVEFNCANTDSPDVPVHVEVVMVKSAFEWLLGIGERVNDFVEALKGCLNDTQPIAPREGPRDGPLKSRWRSARPRATRPLEAWAMEFCDIRGASAHGVSRTASRFVWTAHTHLAFASLLFPLLFKKVASQAGLFKLDDYDVERLRRIDAYLLHDPFVFDWMADETTHPWAEIDINAMISAKVRHFYPGD